jgi:hypothetical protein
LFLRSRCSVRGRLRWGATLPGEKGGSNRAKAAGPVLQNFGRTPQFPRPTPSRSRRKGGDLGDLVLASTPSTTGGASPSRDQCQQFGPFWPHWNLLRCIGPQRCAVVKVCLVLSGASRPRWKKAGKTIRLPSSERSEGTIACGGSDVRPSVNGSRGVRELGHAWVRLDCLNSSSSGCVPSPPGKDAETRIPVSRGSALSLRDLPTGHILQ